MRGGGEDILEHRHAAEGPWNLMRAREPPPASLRRRRHGDVLAEKAHPSAGRRMRADQQAEQSRLARAVRPDDAHRLAGAHRKVDAVEHQERAEAFGQAFPFEKKADRFARRRSRVRHRQLLNGLSFAWIGTFGSVAFSVTGKSSGNFDPAFAFTHCVPMIGPGDTFGTGPEVKSIGHRS